MKLFENPFSYLKKAKILGINRRNLEYVNALNDRENFPKADNKILTKQLAIESGIAVPKMYQDIKFTGDLKNLVSILEPYESFVIKPARGSGGEGVLVVDGRRNEFFMRGGKTLLSLQDLRDHCAGTLHGLYSLGGKPDHVLLEEKVIFDLIFKDLAVSGVPDVRLIVYKGVPILAMLRLPTKASHGRANLHQGAVGVGIDINTGLTTAGVYGNKSVDRHPDTDTPLKNLQLPNWDELLSIASRCYDFSHLGYLGVDIVYDRNRGPLLLEINARPGLAIQIANQVGILGIIERVESLLLDTEMTSQDRVVISKSLFLT